MITECGYTVVSAAIRFRGLRNVIQRILRSKFRAKKTALRRFFFGWLEPLLQYQLVIDSGVRLAFIFTYFVPAHNHVMYLVRSISQSQRALTGIHAC